MTFSIAAPSADDIKKAPRAFGLYRQALSDDGSVDSKVRRSLVVSCVSAGASWGFCWSSQSIFDCKWDPIEAAAGRLMPCGVMLTEVHGAREEVWRQQCCRGAIRCVSGCLRHLCGSVSPAMRIVRCCDGDASKVIIFRWLPSPYASRDVVCWAQQRDAGPAGHGHCVCWNYSADAFPRAVVQARCPSPMQPRR